MNGTHTGTGREIVIADRYNGPPGTGNGGYVAGTVAAALTGPVTVNLRRPPPLERPLRLTLPEPGVAHLHDGDVLIAEAREGALDVDVPPAPGWAEAVAAAARYPGFERHAYPTCFTCGHEREEGDGLRIFSSPREKGEGCAAPWVPHPALAGADGAMPAPIVWAALDCPSGWAAYPAFQSSGFPEGTLVVTAALSARIDAPVMAGQRCTTLGWLTGHDDRKITTGSAVYDEQGTPVAVGTALWIVIRPKET